MSCTMNQTIVIANDGSGTVTTHAEISTLLKDYLASLGEISGNAGALKGGRLFDPAAIRRDFELRPGVSVSKVSTPTSGVLDLDLAFDSLDDLFRGQDVLKDAGAIVVTENGDTRTLRLHLDRATWGQVAGLFPALQDPLLAPLGPQGSGQTTEDDYLAMVKFSIGDAAPALLKKSFVSLTIRPQGTITGQSGGTLVGRAVVFRIPVLRILVLDRPLDYSVTWSSQ
jgi:hypothetical protein